jgi:Abortive infection alpha
MPDESKIRDTVDAVTGLVQAVPVYQDVLQPAFREVGTGLQTIAKTIHIALAPISVLVWGYDEIKEFVSTRVAEKLKDVPPDRILQTPDSHVVGPALEALRFTGPQEHLRELYANLLATSLDADTANKAHPAFVEIINSMTPDEARIMGLFAIEQTLPFIDVLEHVDKDKPGYVVTFATFSFIGKVAGCMHKKLTPSYLDNLIRLGLLEAPRGMWLTAPNVYEPLEELFSQSQTDADARNARVSFKRRIVRLTSLGVQFCNACVIEKGSPAAS